MFIIFFYQNHIALEDIAKSHQNKKKCKLLLFQTAVAIRGTMFITKTKRKVCQSRTRDDSDVISQERKDEDEEFLEKVCCYNKSFKIRISIYQYLEN